MMIATAEVKPRFLQLIQASIYSGLSVTTLRKLIDTGRLPASRPVKGRVLVSTEDLDALMQRSAVARD